MKLGPILAASIGGAAVGSLLTYIFTKKYYVKQMDEEISEVRQFYKEKEAELYSCSCVKQNVPLTEEEAAEFEEMLVKATEDKPLVISSDSEDVEGVDEYEEIKNKMNKKFGENRPDKTKYSDISKNALNQKKKAEKSKAVYPISDDEYTEEYIHYKKGDLLYFTGDGVLFDEMSEKIIPIDEIGENNLSAVGEYSNNLLFVRNDNTASDYCVIFEDGNFADSVYAESYSNVEDD
jgi:hypothetical protein